MHGEPPPLQPLRSHASGGSLDQIRHELPPEIAIDASQVWDVFISHASEDKDAVARPLAEELRGWGVTVWLDETELRIGDSLRRKIDEGLAKSGFGVVVFSHSFFAKGWPQYELDGIVSRSVSGEQTLLPLWHEITKDEVQRHSPSLVDKIARSTSLFTIAEIAEEIASVDLDDDSPTGISVRGAHTVAGTRSRPSCRSLPRRASRLGLGFDFGERGLRRSGQVFYEGPARQDGLPIVVPAWGEPVRLPGAPLPPPVVELLAVWREWRTGDLDATIAEFAAAGFRLSWAQPP